MILHLSFARAGWTIARTFITYRNMEESGSVGFRIEIEDKKGHEKDQLPTLLRSLSPVKVSVLTIISDCVTYFSGNYFVPTLLPRLMLAIYIYMSKIVFL